MKYNSVTIQFLVNVDRTNRLYEFRQSFGEYTPFGRPHIILENEDSLKSALTSKETSPEKASILYFDSSSTFPRFKLKDTKFQRCIKIDKCDCTVIPDKIEYKQGYGVYYIYNFENDYFAVCPDFLKHKDTQLYEFITNHGKIPFIDALIQNDIIKSDWKLIYTGRVLFTDSKYVDTIQNLINIYPSYIKETDLDKFINKDFDSVTEEMLISLNAMFKSKDKSVVELGIKMLQGLNVVECPLSVKCLLLGNWDNIVSNKAYHNTGFEQVRKSLGMTGYIDNSFPRNVANLFSTTVSPSEVDLNLASAILKEMIKNEFEVYGNKLVEMFPKLSLSITTYVE